MGQTFADALATIPINTALSGVISVGAGVPVKISMPASWTAAKLTFQATYDDGANFQDVYLSDGTELQLTVAAAQTISLNPDSLSGIRMFRIRSGTGATPVNQAAARALTVITRRPAFE